MYFDILNWEKYDLLTIDLGLGRKHTGYKKTAISFVQYVWIKMVEALIKYGFSYNDVKAIRKKLSEKLHYSFSSNQKIAQNKRYKPQITTRNFMLLNLKGMFSQLLRTKTIINSFFIKMHPKIILCLMIVFWICLLNSMKNMN